jgi:Asp-tRNA(Asn)/Glu-tRNA(Gln) amidotransferase A subunit family amidase
MSAPADPARLGAAAAAAAIAAGRLGAEELLSAVLARIDARDGEVHAWACVDAEGAWSQARALDRQEPRGPLHGVPVGIKDVIDVAGIPSAYGSAAFASNIAGSDAACVARLRRAGAVILGKTITAEFATYHPGPTRNPRDRNRTPGGSSSGSAAAVADCQVPLALGTQTAGSVIRPASFCGIFGFKPSFGRYDIAGMLPTAPSLDTLGGFARSVEDIALLDAVLADEEHVALPAPREMRIGICRSPAWEQASPDMRHALESAGILLSQAGWHVSDVDLGEAFMQLPAAQAVLHRHEAFRCLGVIRRAHADLVSEVFRNFIDAGEHVSAEEYAAALATQAACRAELDTLLPPDTLWLTPGAPGVAPEGIAATGDPAFSRIWTALGVPCLGFPAALDAACMPLGLQWIAGHGADRAMLSACVELCLVLGAGQRISFPD